MSWAVCSSLTIIKDKPKLKVNSSHDITSLWCLDGLNSQIVDNEKVLAFIRFCFLNQRRERMDATCPPSESSQLLLNQNNCGAAVVRIRLENWEMSLTCWCEPFTSTKVQHTAVWHDTWKKTYSLSSSALIWKSSKKCEWVSMPHILLPPQRHEWVWMGCWAECCGKVLLWELGLVQPGITAWGAACVQWTVLSTLGEQRELSTSENQ